MASLLEQNPGIFLRQYKKLADHLEGDDITEGMLWSGWLSRPEWEFVYCLSFAMEGAGISRAATLNGLMIAAMAYVEERGFRFRGLRVNEHQQVIRLQHGMIEPRNGLFILLLQRGKVPDYVTHFARAVFLAENRFKDDNLRDLLRAAQSDLVATLSTMPEAPRDFRDAVKERVGRLKALAGTMGVDLSQPAALEGLMRADSETQTIEEEIDE